MNAFRRTTDVILYGSVRRSAKTKRFQPHSWHSAVQRRANARSKNAANAFWRATGVILHGSVLGVMNLRAN